jgi:hypothetical protein
MAARRQVQDAEPSVTETDVRQHLGAGVVWSTPAHYVAHPIHDRSIDRFAAVINDAADAAHGEG